jgi:RNA polymerase sigma-70 factor (ECF subfamily)
MTISDEPDWRQIVERHSKRVFMIAKRILGSTQDAEDVAQETFTEVYRLHQLGPVQSWTGLLVRIATVRSLDQLRRRKSSVPAVDIACKFSTHPLDVLATRELADNLRHAVAKLPDQQATIFVLTFYEQMTRDEIANHLDVSVESISTALYKARKRLAELLIPVRLGE